MWAHTISARELAQKIDRLLVPQGGERALAGLQVVVPTARRSPRERLAVYQDQFSHLFAADVGLFDGSLGRLIVSDALVSFSRIESAVAVHLNGWQFVLQASVQAGVHAAQHRRLDGPQEKALVALSFRRFG